MRLAIDTGGTFTDLVLEADGGELSLFKVQSTPADPVQGVLDVLAVAAAALGSTREALLARCELFVHGTTRATNAILTAATARTAFLTTQGHPDVLLFREGGRTDVFNWSRPYPEPYVPRSLTFEVPERIGADGALVRPLEPEAAVSTIKRLGELGIEAVAVCFLWATANPSHERAVGELLDRHLPGVPYTLSHQLNPTIREYRRASATAIDASLKPLMTAYLNQLTARLRRAGLDEGSRVLIVTASGGVVDATDMAARPILSIGSGPAMAPVAGRACAREDAQAETVIVSDAGGTSYDVSVVRRGQIPVTRETWLGDPYFGHMTGFPSIDVRSVGAGGGSLAWVDDGGLLHVGPQSAGADPGPVCYGRGGVQPTVTDAALALGWIDPDYFLGGSMRLDGDAARAALQEQVGEPLGLDTDAAAAAVMTLVTERMARAIEEITVNQGIDPRTALLLGGGGAAGLNVVAIARRLGCPRVLVPEIAAALSAAGALLSDLTAEYAETCATRTGSFDAVAVNGTLAALDQRCEAFRRGPGAAARETAVERTVEARYVGQTWEIRVPVRTTRFSSQADVRRFCDEFHATHHELFAVHDPLAEIELLTWHARVRCRLRDAALPRVTGARADRQQARRNRTVTFPGSGRAEARVLHPDELAPGASIRGPAIVESPITTVVVNPGASVERRGSSLVIDPGTDE